MKTNTLFIFGVLLSMLASSSALATDLNFVGAGTYNIHGSSITVNFDRVENNDSSFTSGTIFLKLIASPDNDPTGNAYTLTEGALSDFSNAPNGGVLEPGSAFTNISFTRAYTPPPPGDYYVFLIVSEWPNTSTILDSTPAVDNPAFLGGSSSGGGSGNGGSGNGGSGNGGAGGGATGITMACPCSWETSGSSLNLKLDRLTNNQNGSSGTLRLELWATENPYAGGLLSGYQIGVYEFSETLEPNAYFYDIDRNVNYDQPPKAKYYTTMVVSQWNGSEFTIQDYTTFSSRDTMGGGGTTTLPDIGSSGSGGGGGSSSLAFLLVLLGLAAIGMYSGRRQ